LGEHLSAWGSEDFSAGMAILRLISPMDYGMADGGMKQMGAVM
jgi:hypothetical protein